MPLAPVEGAMTATRVQGISERCDDHDMIQSTQDRTMGPFCTISSRNAMEIGRIQGLPWDCGPWRVERMGKVTSLSEVSLFAFGGKNILGFQRSRAFGIAPPPSLCT